MFLINWLFLNLIKAKEYIGDILPKEYDDDKKSMLEGFLESSGIKLLKYEKSELDQIINTIMNLTPNYEEQEVKIF